MSINSKMTAIADEIRELAGTTGAMGLDAMAEYVSEANVDVTTETDLIAQIAGALEGKAIGESNVDMCTVNFQTTNSSYTNILLVHYTTVDANGKVIGSLLNNVSPNISIQCVCGTPIDGIFPPTAVADINTVNVKKSLSAGSSAGCFFYGLLTAPRGGTSTFTFI